jgi:hypothetical protein
MLNAKWSQLKMSTFLKKYCSQLLRVQHIVKPFFDEIFSLHIITEVNFKLLDICLNVQISLTLHHRPNTKKKKSHCFVICRFVTGRKAFFWSWNILFYVPETHIMYFIRRCWFLKCSEEIHYVPTSGFWPRVRCVHPSFWAHWHCKRGAARPPVAASLLPPPKNKLFPETKCFPSGPNSVRQGRISFHWA